jgi:hypothetical protein
MFLNSVSDIKTTKLSASSAVPAASQEVLTKLRVGRHAIAISATDSDVYLGGEDVTSSTGMLIKTGTTFVMPVTNHSKENIYVVGGDCVLTEFF